MAKSPKKAVVVEQPKQRTGAPSYLMSASTKQMLATIRDPHQRAIVKKIMIQAEQKAAQVATSNKTHKPAFTK